MLHSPAVEQKANNGAIGFGLLLAVFLWGGSNAATKFVVKFWPPIFAGSTRFLLAGCVFLALLRWTKLFGTRHQISKEVNRKLWLRTGLGLAAYITVFNWALKLTAVSHVVLYLGAAPVWALLWEGKPEKTWKSVQRFAAAGLALFGVAVLIWPTLKGSSTHLVGEILGMCCGVLWAYFGLQCRDLSSELSSAEITAHSFLRSGVIAAPVAAIEYAVQGAPLRVDIALAHSFCILGGGIAAFVLWNHGLRHWKTSQVYLFNNLIPLSTMAWANVCLGEPITSTFWLAMLLIASGVMLGQANWQKLFGNRLALE